MLPVLVDTEHLDRAVVAEVGAACALARAEVVGWSCAAAEPVPSAALVVGSLRRGERRIPPPLMDAVQRIAPDASLLLMSDEPLVRPVVATHGGRVTLIEQTASPARIRGTVRMLLAAHLRDEHLDPHVWTAVLRSQDDAMPPPAIRRGPAGALTAVVPFRAGWSGAELLADDVHGVAVARIDDEERLQRLREMLSRAAGMIHLAEGLRQWTAYWPSLASPLLLCSPLRLPRLFNLAEAAAHQILHLTASPGDLIVALDRWLPPGHAFSDGGAAFLEHFETRIDVAARPAGLVVEIR